MTKKIIFGIAILFGCFVIYRIISNMQTSAVKAKTGSFRKMDEDYLRNLNEQGAFKTVSAKAGAVRGGSVPPIFDTLILKIMTKQEALNFVATLK